MRLLRRFLIDERPTLEENRVRLRGIGRLDELPKEARQYVEYVETLAGCPVSMVSVGPERHATLLPQR